MNTSVRRIATSDFSMLDADRGLFATHGFIYAAQDYVVTTTLTDQADQIFFDRDGLLWFLSTSHGTLEAQSIAR